MSEREKEIEELFAAYVDRLNEGEELDADTILAENPYLGPELLTYLDEYLDASSNNPSSASLGTLGDYTLRRQIGRGGMGVVYEAWENSMDRAVALKVLPAGIAADTRACARFMREAQAAGKLSHPNVVPVFFMGVKEQTPFYAMEYVEGETLAEVLAKIRKVEPEGHTVFGHKDGAGYFESLARAFAHVSDGLQHAHSKGVVHRDIKPSNLILDSEGKLRILDFGLARLEGQESLTLSGDLVGTPAYMSPEQAKRRKIPIDHRTDIYSLGTTLYELLTHEQPFRGKDHQDTLSQIIESDPRPPRQLNPRVPADLETVVLKCLRKDAGDRYGTAEALGQDLRRFVRGDPVEARAQAPWVLLRRRAWRNRTRLLVGAGTVLVLLSLVLLLAKHFGDLRREEAEIHAQRVKTYEEKVLGAVMKIAMGRPKRESDGPAGNKERGEEKRSSEDRTVRAGSKTDGSLDLPVPAAHAARELREAVKIFPDRPDAHYHLARALGILGMREAALKELSLVIHLDEHFAPALTLKKAILAEENEDAARDDDNLNVEATEIWQKAWATAHATDEKENWKEAAEAYTTLFETLGNEPYLGASIEIRLGRGNIYLNAERYERALADFAAAEGQWPGALEPAVMTAKTLYLMGDEEVARNRFERLFARAPPGFESAVALEIAQVYHEDDHAESLRWTLRADESPLSCQVAANLLRRLGRLDEAVPRAERAVELAPDDASARYTLGRTLLAQRRFEDAVAELRRALELGLARAYVHNDLGLALIDSGRRDEGIVELRKATEVDPTYAPAQHNLGRTLMESGKTEDAIAPLRKATEIKPRHGTYEQLGKALRTERKLEEALVALRKSSELEPSCAEAHLLIARTLFELKRPDDAIAELRAAIEANPEDHNLRRNLGHLLEQLGRLGEAAEEHEKPARDEVEARLKEFREALKEQAEGDTGKE